MTQKNYNAEEETEELIRVGKLPKPLRLAAMLEKTMQGPLHGKAADCLREMYEALQYYEAQPQQEPVATVQCIHGVTIGYLDVMQPVGTKLYTSPPQPQQEPVAWVCYGSSDGEMHDIDFEQKDVDALPVGTMLYISPPSAATQHERKPLTDEEILYMCTSVPDYDIGNHDLIQFARAIEAAHGIKENT